MARTKKPQLSAFIKGAVELAAVIPEGAAILRADGCIVYMNERLIELCGDHCGKYIRDSIATRNGISPFGLLPDNPLTDGKLRKVVETQSSRGESGIVIHLKDLNCPESGLHRLMLVSYSKDQLNTAGSEVRLPYEVLASRCSVFARLAAGVVHEANNHFGGISQSAQVLHNLFNLENPRTLEILKRDGYPSGGIETIRDFIRKRQAADFVDVISDSSQKAFDVINTFLDILRAADPELNRYDMNEAVKKALYLARFEKDMREECGFREIDVKLSLKNDLPKIMCDQRFLITAIVFALKHCCIGLRNSAQADSSFVSYLKLATSKKSDKYIKLSISCNANLKESLAARCILMDAARYLVQEIHQGELESGADSKGHYRVDFLIKTALC